MGRCPVLDTGMPDVHGARCPSKRTFTCTPMPASAATTSCRSAALEYADLTSRNRPPGAASTAAHACAASLRNVTQYHLLPGLTNKLRDVCVAMACHKAIPKQSAAGQTGMTCPVRLRYDYPSLQTHEHLGKL